MHDPDCHYRVNYHICNAIRDNFCPFYQFVFIKPSNHPFRVKTAGRATTKALKHKNIPSPNFETSSRRTYHIGHIFAYSM